MALVALALAADLVSTVAGVGRGYIEGNPVVRAALADAGVAGLLALKLGVALVGVPARRLLPWPQREVVPLGLSLPWLAAAAVSAATRL